MSRVLIVVGLMFLMSGILYNVLPRIPFRLGRLPLDFHYQRENVSVYFPIGTSILLSVVVSIFFMLIGRK